MLRNAYHHNQRRQMAVVSLLAVASAVAVATAQKRRMLIFYAHSYYRSNGQKFRPGSVFEFSISREHMMEEPDLHNGGPCSSARDWALPAANRKPEFSSEKS